MTSGKLVLHCRGGSRSYERSRSYDFPRDEDYACYYTPELVHVLVLASRASHAVLCTYRLSV